LVHGKQIRVFLTDGSPSGIRFAELVNWTGQGFACPAGLLTKLGEWPETQRPGVYVLLGVDENGEDLAYIGESENVAHRLLSHVKNGTLEEIIEVFFFTSKDNNLTKGHIAYLERQLLLRAAKTQRFPLKNHVSPAEKALSRPELATMEEFLDNLYLVAESLGYNIFASNLKAETLGSRSELYFFATESGLKAQAMATDEGFMVKAGSTAKAGDCSSSLGPGYKLLRDELLKNGVLVDDPVGQSLVFRQDYQFRSSTAAVCVIAAQQRSGPLNWRRADGTLLKDAEEAQAAAAEKQLLDETAD